MRLTKLPALALAPLALSALLAGCGSSEEDDPSDSRSLEERLFAGREGDFAQQQQLIRECMVEQGFEYTPVDNRGAEGGGPGRPDERSEEFIKEFGFGISTLFASGIKIGPADDPNSTYRDSLSESQKEAYNRALYGEDFGKAGGGGFVSSSGGVSGPVASVQGVDGEATEFKGPGGCLGEALEATGGGPQNFDASLFDDLEELEERIKADPKIVELMKKWSTCMTDAGYNYRDLDAAMDEIQEEFGELTGLEVDGDGFRMTVRAQVSSEDAGDGKAFDPLANVDKEKLAELQAKEKRIAAAAWDCIEEIDGLEVEQEVREKYESEFLEDHPDLKAD